MREGLLLILLLAHPAIASPPEPARAQFYGPSSTGFFLGLSPYFDSTIAREMGSTTAGRWEFGFRSDWLSVEAWATNERKAGLVSTEYPANTNGGSEDSFHYHSYGVGAQADFPLLTTPLNPGLFHFFIPVAAGLFRSVGFYDHVTWPATTRDYSNTGLDIASGAGVAWYSGTYYGIYVTGLYRRTLASSRMREDSGLGLLSEARQPMTGALTGFELKLGASFSFGMNVPSLPVRKPPDLIQSF